MTIRTRWFISGAVAMAALFSVSMAYSQGKVPPGCRGLPSAAQLRQYLLDAAAGSGLDASLGAPGSGVGGLFQGKRMWGAIVNRDGELCGAITSTNDPHQVWPGSQQIAKAKAYTANAFSNETTPLSTASLYLLSQPGHSLYGLNQSNPFNPHFLAPTDEEQRGERRVAGGIITFGGGVPLYGKDGQVIGGLGVSGDTACADHEIAKRARDRAGMNPPSGPLADDIKYINVDPPNVLSHPLCLTTVRNGAALGDEKP